ncbi:hypothetical protein GCM10009830_46230 [Glycomyces endophyticus]|uniref:Uncharacterized protein n=1 Tax=Glycomyces endophyticus TaxID=480996 RepID=A0ABP4TTT7_9ACTN
MTEPSPENEPEAKQRTAAADEPEARSEAEAEPEARSAPVPETEAEADSEAEPDSGTPEPGAAAASDPDTRSDAEAEPESEAVLRLQVGPEATESESGGDLPPELGPMPGEGKLAVAALWLFATGCCVGFLIPAAILFFDLASGQTPAGQIVRSVLSVAGFGALTVLHVAVALNLRAGGNRARIVAVVLQAAAIGACLVGTAVAVMPRFDLSTRYAGLFLLASVLFASLITMLSTHAMRDWCDPSRGVPMPEGKVSRLLR